MSSFGWLKCHVAQSLSSNNSPSSNCPRSSSHPQKIYPHSAAVSCYTNERSVSGELSKEWHHHEVLLSTRARPRGLWLGPRSLAACRWCEPSGCPSRQCRWSTTGSPPVSQYPCRMQPPAPLATQSADHLQSRAMYNSRLNNDVKCQKHIYLRQGGNVFAGFPLCVYLCVRKITQKVMDWSFWNFEGMSGMAQTTSDSILGVIQKESWITLKFSLTLR